MPLLRLPIILLLTAMVGGPLFAQAGDDEIESMLRESEEIRKNVQINSGTTLTDSSGTSGTSSQRNILSNFVNRVSMPNIFVSADFVGDFNVSNADTQSKDNYFVREVEFGFGGSIDYLLVGQLNIAIHNERGAFFAELHEVYFEFPTLLWNLYLKVGNFFFDAGRLNTRHRHDWDFTVAPMIHERLFDEEAAEDTGAELSYLMPLPFYQEIKFGVFNGRTFGHTHNDGFKKPHPLYLGRIKNFFELPFRIGMEWGLSFLRYNVTKSARDADYTYGSDLTFKWRRSNLQNITWSSEFWYRVKERALDTGPTEKVLGFYSYVEYSIYSMWIFGFMFQYYSEPDLFSNRLNARINPQSYAQTLWFTWRPSEFSYFRFSIERNDPYNEKDHYIFYIQTDFIIGFHPAHRF